jgi:hypothetical protein
LKRWQRWVYGGLVIKIVETIIVAAIIYFVID